MKTNVFNHRKITLLSLLVFSFLVSLLIIKPYINPIILGFIVSILFLPIHIKIKAIIHGKNLSAIISCFALIFIVIMPLLFVASQVVAQAIHFGASAYSWISNNGFSEMFSDSYFQRFIQQLNIWFPFLNIRTASLMQESSSLLSSASTSLLKLSTKTMNEISSLFLNFCLMIFVVFFALRDNENLFKVLNHIIPFSNEQKFEILNLVKNVSKSAILGSFLTALSQGVIAGIGMFIIGLPGLFLGTATVFASFVPFVGSALVWIPTAIYLFFTGHTVSSIFISIYCAVIIGIIDTFLRPILMKGQSSLNTLVLFFSLLGGIHFFGIIGLIYGPLIFSITILLFNLAEQEFIDN